MRRLRTKSVVVIALTVVISVTAMMTACSRENTAPAPQAGVNAGPDGKPAPFKEPVRLSSKDGVLEVRLSAHQSTVNLDTVKEPVTNFMTYGFDLIKGTSSDGASKGDHLYPGPTLRVEPGEKLIVHYDNDLAGPRHPGLLRSGLTPKGGDVPIYPPALKQSPLNLHTHGLHVSPSGQRRQRAAVDPGWHGQHLLPTTSPRRCPTGSTGTTATGTR